MKLNPLHCIDAYKFDHRRQYPAGTTLVYSNFTPRSRRLSNIPPHLSDGRVAVFGVRFFCKDFLVDSWRDEFFTRRLDDVVREYRRRADHMIGKGAVPVDHIVALHDLGYLPICVRSLPEGSRVPYRVPCMVLYNTHPDFSWLTNYLETALSAYVWKPMTTATLAAAYRRLLDRYAAETGTDPGFVDFQAHDFSCRGMSGLHDAALSGAAFLTSFKGTDTVAAIDLIEQYYDGDAEREILGCSVPASEHSVMCMGTCEDEIGTFRRLITELYPSGIVSIVSDTWDFWKVVTEYARELREDILARAGKTVLRPDSGDPVRIICGDPEAPMGSPEWKGAVHCLWEVFGGSHTAEGYRLLDARVGLIYGDSITLERAEAILEWLKRKGFASGNVILGVGSFSAQYVTRDTHGFAVKSTCGMVNGEVREIFKTPKTDSGTKNSARGFLKVERTPEGSFRLLDRQLDMVSPGDAMVEVFRDGVLYNRDDFATIRRRIRGEV